MYIGLLTSTGIIAALILGLNTAIFLLAGFIMVIISFALKGSTPNKNEKITQEKTN
jgi:uncharacterized membrane protein